MQLRKAPYSLSEDYRWGPPPPWRYNPAVCCSSGAALHTSANRHNTSSRSQSFPVVLDKLLFGSSVLQGLIALVATGRMQSLTRARRGGCVLFLQCSPANCKVDSEKQSGLQHGVFAQSRCQHHRCATQCDQHSQTVTIYLL